MMTSVNNLRAAARDARLAGRLDDAIGMLAAASEIAPEVAAIHHDLGALYRIVGRLAEAEEALRLAFRIKPNEARTRHALGTVLLAQGRYREGWPLYEARREFAAAGAPGKPSFAQWQGEDLAGRSIAILPDEGYGDQIQFARFAPWLAGKGARVTLVSPPPLTRLFARNLGVDVVEASGGFVALDPPDYAVLSTSIAAVADLSLEELPNAPYLGADPHPRAAGRIGIVTRGNAKHANDAHRSLPGEAADALMALPGALSLDPADLGVRDFQDTATVIAGLDLVITVDTAVAHLAGAMGRAVWILLPFLNTDWRWMTHRTDTPWYPSARLFRQPAAGDWRPVLSDVREAVARR
jgi:tetratricopeptide (TPR) repeat protein